MWLGADLPEDSQHDPLARQTEMLLLEAWLSIALDRELKRAYTGKADGEAREDTAGHASVMKMPFRGDNCESIFLAYVNCLSITVTVILRGLFSFLQQFCEGSRIEIRHTI